MELPATQIVSFSALGITPEFFHAPHTAVGDDGGVFNLEYYLIGATSATTVCQSDWWNILAVGFPANRSHELLLRQLHINEEFLEDETFDAWTDSLSLQSLRPSGIRAFQAFLIQLAHRITIAPSFVPQHRYFVAASAADYALCGIPQGLLDRFAIHFTNMDIYRYHPDDQEDAATVQDSGCGFLRISAWAGSKHPLSTTMFAALETYTTARIAEMRQQWSAYLRTQATEPRVDARWMDGESFLRLSQGALLELAALLGARLEELHSPS